MDECPSRGEHRNRAFRVRKRPAHPFGQRHGGCGRLRRDHQDRHAIFERKPRAGAHARASDAGGEPANPFEPRGAGIGQAGSESGKVDGQGIARRHWPLRNRCGARGSPQAGGRGIHPDHARGLDRAEPSRDRARHVGREPRVADKGKDRFRHCERRMRTTGCSRAFCRQALKEPVLVRGVPGVHAEVALSLHEAGITLTARLRAAFL